MPTIPAPGATDTTQQNAMTSSTKSVLGKDDFLKLLVGQLKNQDPMNPTSDTEFIGQMAQFSQLEQTTNMAAGNAELLTQQRGARAVTLLGRTVTYPDALSGVPTSGTVERVEYGEGQPKLTVGGKAGIDPDTVTAVQ